MPRFEPFRGVRYGGEIDLGDVTAPPYDVIDDELRADLARRHPHQAVLVDLPVDGPDGEDRYDVACRLLHEWLDASILRPDPAESLYVYRMDYADEQGVPRHTTGVVGALELSPPGEGGILPHEHTTPKAKSDRLQMLRSCRANLSAIWGLSPAPGLTDACTLATEPAARWPDDEGVTHSLWPVTDPERIARIRALVEGAPVVIADGHHRYETSLAYRDERRQAGDVEGPADLVMTYVVELAEHELLVQPIHRLITGLAPEVDLVDELAPWFDAEEVEADPALTARLPELGALALVTRSGAWLLRPRADAFEGERDLDSSRLERALAGIDGIEVRYQHGTEQVLAAVDKGDAQAGVLLRPATVAQIVQIADGGDRMPPKTTFFSPKPRTGVVFRLLD